ncbi:hypothetical protein K432DRAFT_377329 [Lepidopterella palustris CBS 459.81]|uniref:Uncharacterized protein n=1 Tax=Lepidopterella palustris CBS 459.81 TaxID=1314670 RepID=A0A8E2EKR5_9PEZI|nr:hypothetical protein K432DRAFT_377329 [Lepidopterella palustris CBS 459.81]
MNVWGDASLAQIKVCYRNRTVIVLEAIMSAFDRQRHTRHTAAYSGLLSLHSPTLPKNQQGSVSRSGKRPSAMHTKTPSRFSSSATCIIRKDPHVKNIPSTSRSAVGKTELLATESCHVHISSAHTRTDYVSSVNPP